MLQPDTSSLRVAEESGNPLPFWGLMFFTFVLFVGPQYYFPFLESMHLAKLSAGAALLLYLTDRLSPGRPFTVNTRPVRLVLYLLLFALLSIPFSRWPGGSVDELTNSFLKSILVFFLIANTVTTMRRMRLFIGSMAIWCLIMTWTGIRDYSSGNLIVGGTRILGYEAPLTSDPNDFALTLNLVLGFMVGMYLGADTFLRKLVLLVTMVLFAVGVVISFSRGGFLTLAALLVVLIVKRVKERGVAALGPFAVLLLLAVLFAPQGYGDRVYSIFDTSADPTGSADVRWNIMVEGFWQMLRSPLVGFGLGMHGVELAATGHGWSGVHSAFIQIGADLGVPAFLCLLVLIWELLKGLYQARTRLAGSPQCRDLSALSTGIELSLVAFVVGGFLLPVAYRFYLYYVAGLAVALGGIVERHCAVALYVDGTESA